VLPTISRPSAPAWRNCAASVGIGNVVNLASRICGAAEDGQILMDAAVAAEIGDALPLVPLGSRMLRGLTETVSLFSVRPTAPNLTKLPPGKVLAVQRNAWQS